jgi:hypothetical protein
MGLTQIAYCQGALDCVSAVNKQIPDVWLPIYAVVYKVCISKYSQ